MVLRPTIRWLIILALALFTLKVAAEPVAVDEGTCEFNDKGELTYGGPVQKPCTLMLDKQEPNFLYFKVEEKGTTTMYRWDVQKQTGVRLSQI